MVGLAFLSVVPDDVDPGSGQDADGMRVVFAAVAGRVADARGPGIVVPRAVSEVADGVYGAGGLAAHRKACEMRVPDWRVTAATPARAARDGGSGNRERQSPFRLSACMPGMPIE